MFRCTVSGGGRDVLVCMYMCETGVNRGCVDAITEAVTGVQESRYGHRCNIIIPSFGDDTHLSHLISMVCKNPCFRLSFFFPSISVSVFSSL